MSEKKFTHLHVHTAYSLLDGSSKIGELISRTKELGMDAIAITDHGVMYGCIDFYKEALKQGIKPIIGCEVYIASGSRFNKTKSDDNFYYHLVLLAKNNNGYKNLSRLVSLGQTEGYYYKPRIDLDILKKYKDDLIALSACLAGPVAKTILTSTYEKAKAMAVTYQNIFGDDFYLELQDHGIAEQKTVNNALMRIHNETGIPLVATNDLHYVNRDDASAHDLLLCIQTVTNILDENRMRYEGGNYYLKSPEEMYSLFPYAEEACENTNKIAEQCNVTFEFNKYKLPVFDVPEGKTAYEYLYELTQKGIKERYGDPTDEIKERLQYELDTIKQMGFVDYFLITWDFIRFAKENGISVGPGRGSAAGSVVSYALKITDIDPFKYGLIFERFLNPERVSMPDIDIDFCYERRQEVIDYVNRKYGSDRVAQIITFGTMAARNAIRDVGRALAIPYNDVDRIAKMVPMELHISIKQALEKNYELRQEYENDPQVKNLIDMSMKLEGLPRHASTHAAGIVICDRPIIEYVPLNNNQGVVTTQYTMTTLEELGLLKMDFLGLRTLTVIQDAFDDIERQYHKGLTVDSIDYNDEKVFELISSGLTSGVFQLESAGMQSFMKELKPTCLEDIIAGISLYRPGPMDFIPKYIEGKNNKDKITYLHPSLEPILKTTYGCIVYQEQVMQIVRELAGYSWGRSDLVRRAMSKKKADVMAQERKNFIYGLGEDVPGCIKNGIPEDVANTIFDEMTDFAKYAFNKSHAAAYAVVAYRTAWLKCYYPVEFMAALLTSVIDNPGKVVVYIEEAKRMNIEILPPDINKSCNRFRGADGKIRYALSAVKTVGRGVVDDIEASRERDGDFTSLTSFIDRMSGKINSKAIENLIKCGAFDSLGGKRAAYMTCFRQILDGFTQAKKNNAEGQLNLFDISEDKSAYEDHLPDVKEFEEKQKLAFEKEILGIYVSGHPLSEYAATLKKYASVSTLDFPSDDTEEGKVKDNEKIKLGGIISKATIKFTKNDKTMCFIQLEDLYGMIEIIVFPNVYEKFNKYIAEDSVILVEGTSQLSENQPPKVLADKIIPYEELENRCSALWLKLDKQTKDIPTEIKQIMRANPGRTPVKIYYQDTKRLMTVSKGISLNSNAYDDLVLLLGRENVKKV
ncbi:MAG: DNA polymerase III subunit alpha [Eubacterium sp.]|nr:DNA polymerase III subunit alpha [Eubacterium sp.]